MRMLTFANRNTKEILRDPINLFFGLLVMQRKEQALTFLPL